MNVAPLGKEKLVFIAVAALCGLFLLWFFLSIRGEEAPERTSTPASARPNPAQTVEPDSAATEISLAERDTGLEWLGKGHDLTDEELKNLAVDLISFDTSKQTRSEWEKLQDKWVIFTPQDFPKEMVWSFAPPAAEWVGSREFRPTKVEALPSQYAQGQPMVVNRILGYQLLKDANGNLIDKQLVTVLLTTQCVTEDIDSCRVLSYETDVDLRQYKF